MSAVSAFYDTPGARDDAEISHIAHAAATATEILCAYRSPCRAKLNSVKWVPFAAVTGANTDSTNINIINRGTDGTGTTEIGNVDFAAGTNAAATTAKSIYAPAAGSELQMSEGSVVTATFEKVGNGLALPAGTFVFNVTPN